MKILVLLVLARWTLNMVNTQGYSEPDITSCEKCEFTKTYRGGREGIFTSPGFPDNYPERTTCCYSFHAKDDGRVLIEFDYFDLEPSDHECRYDYLKIWSINAEGSRDQPESVFCGKSKPTDYISTHSRLEVEFHSDVTTIARGFLAHYTFLDKNWHPFSPSTIGCGPGYLTGQGGVIISPNYPSPYPAETGCTWVIEVPVREQILFSFISMDITSNVKCQDSNILMLFEGFVTQDKAPVNYCGQLHQEPDHRHEYLSSTNRLTVRFQSQHSNPGNKQGFKAVWTAVTVAKTGTCQEFECSRVGEGACQRMTAVTGPRLCEEHHYCIHKSLQCNEVPNCGALDSSDETKCLNHIMRYVGYIGGPVLALIIIIVVVICCYRRHCRPRVRYSVPKEQSIAHSMTHSMTSTQSSNVHVRSLDHSPRSSCVMYTTSFTDSTFGDHLSANSTNTNANTSANANTNFSAHASALERPNNTNSNSNSNPNSNSNSLARAQTPNNATTEKAEDDPNHPPSYRHHQKRPSYHLMRELCYEDGNIVIADI